MGSPVDAAFRRVSGVMAYQLLLTRLEAASTRGHHPFYWQLSQWLGKTTARESYEAIGRSPLNLCHIPACTHVGVWPSIARNHTPMEYHRSVAQSPEL